LQFDDAFRAKLRDLLIWRRDVRRFRTDPLPSGALERLIDLACLAPSVGLSQPWRFVIVDDPGRRQAVLENFRAANADALKSYAGDLAARYAELKLAGLQEAPGQLAIFADLATDTGHGLGRRTMPEMAEYSVVAAIGTMWLAARAEAPDRLLLSRLSAGRRCQP
jgi:5,6-dimethylbenzimidazole synthase